MESFDLDLEDLDLKSVDIKPATPTPNEFRNISFSSSQSPAITLQPSQPNLTISSCNNDAMPSFNSASASGLSSDKGIDFGLDLLMNKKKNENRD